LSSVVALALAVWALGERADALAAREKIEEQRRKADRLAAFTSFEQGLLCGEQQDSPRCLLWLARSLKESVKAEAAELEESIRKQLGAWRQDLHPLKGIVAHQD